MKKFTVILIIALFICSCSSTPSADPFTVDLLSPRHEIGTVEAYFEKTFSIDGIKKDNITVYYYPGDDVVCLQFHIQFVSCSQFWDRNGRDGFIKAFQRYQEEYEQRQLVKKNRKTREMYGMVQGFFTWKRTSISIQAHGYPKIKFGYQFKDKAVFFSTTQMESYYEDPLSRSRNQTSAVTEVFFTRAQAESLIALFNQEYLNGFRSPLGTNRSDNVETEMDRY